MDTPTSLHSTPISRLSADILLLIFSANADMFTSLEYDLERAPHPREPSALDSALLASRVCQSWRTLLLESTLIWGRILRVDRLYQLGREGREEVMRRTGSAPLCFTGIVTDSVPFIMDFVRPMLHANWLRIQKFHVKFPDVSRFERSFWDILLRQRRPWNGSTSKPYPCSTSSHPTTLISHSSPTMRHGYDCYTPADISFSLTHADHWLGQLRSLKLMSEFMDADQLFNSIKHMPHLEYLHLNLLSGYVDPLTAEAESIHLPHLVELVLCSLLHIGLTFARSIKPASCCALWYVPWIQEVPTKEDVEATMDILDRYSTMYFSHQPTLLPLKALLILNRPKFFLGIFQADHDPSLPEAVPNFVVSLASNSGWPEGVDSAYFFTPPRRQLRIVDEPHGFSGVLSGVELLQTTWDGLYALIDHTDGQVLRRLRTVRLRSRAPTSKSEFWPVFLGYYGRRKRGGNPIEVMDIGRNPGYNFECLEEAEGLTVRWRKGDVVFEYMCGSGAPWRLKFRE
ncbi:hypothetical protein CPB84DRAFT_1851308 [Gymnopilus junonius]|uniref:F-box domain-containing protein n=1 Tax=Gymnopilus junonius TaxID=109634 RepID=A0A9P5NGK0_GYMJU|nr:hypothetical protein CPB84DRAFT_1851308 [Gymnopilus junonius]